MSMTEDPVKPEQLLEAANRAAAIVELETLLAKIKTSDDGRIGLKELADVLRPGSLAALAGQAGAQLKIVNAVGAVYAPDLEVYKPDQKNNKHAQMFEDARAGRATITVECRTKEGQREAFTLKGYEAFAYLREGAQERRDYLERRILERRWDIAREAAHKLAENAGRPVEKVLRPHEEAALVGFGFLLEGKTKLREGRRTVTKRAMVLNERALPLLEREIPDDLQLLREDIFASFDFSPAAFQTVSTTAPYLDNEFLPNWGYGNAQQVLITDVWDEQAKAEFAYRHDPVGKKAIHVIRDFTLDRGLKIQCKSKKIQKVVDEFWERESMDERCKQWVIVSSKMGELFVRRWPIGGGKLKVRSLRADTIVEIVTDAEDFEEVFTYIQAYQTRFTTYMDNIPKAAETHYVFREIPAKVVRHYKLNCDDYDIRGRSDLFCALPWMKALRDYLYTVVQKEQTAAAYVWDYKVNGGAGDIARVANGLPKGKVDPGAYHIHNDKVEVTAVGADPKNTTGSNSPYEGLLNHCAVAVEIPREYLGSGSRSTRANTLVATDPTVKRFGERQDWFANGAIKDTINDVIDEAIKFDSSLKGEDREFTVVTPTIMRADAKERVELLGEARAAGVLSHETMAEKIYAELEDENLDYDKEVAKIKKELQDPVKSTIAQKSEQVFTAPFLRIQELAAQKAANDAIAQGQAANGAGAGATGQEMGHRPTGPNASDITGTANDGKPVPGPGGGTDAGDASPASATGAAKIKNEQG